MFFKTVNNTLKTFLNLIKLINCKNMTNEKIKTKMCRNEQKILHLKPLKDYLK